MKPLDHDERHAVNDKRAGDKERIVGDRAVKLFKKHSRNHCGDHADDDLAPEHPRSFLLRGAFRRCERIEATEKHHHDRKDCAELYHDLEHLGKVL